MRWRLQIEGIVDGGVHAEEALGGSSRLEPLLLALSSPHGLMRILRPIILPKRLLMRTGQSETAERRGVGALNQTCSSAYGRKPKKTHKKTR